MSAASPSLRPSRVLPALLLLLLLAWGCAPLPTITADGRCGNSVVEPAAGEDCDGYAAGNEACGKPSTSAACRFVCGVDNGGAVCPPGFECGLDEICRASAGRFDAPQGLPILLASEVHLGDVNGDHHTDFVVVDDQGVGVYLGGLLGGYARIAGTPSGVGRISVALGHLTTGVEDDAAFLVDDGLVHAVGGATGQLLPVAYPTSTAADPGQYALVPVHAAAPYTADVVLALSADPSGRISAVVLGATSTDDTAVRALMATTTMTGPATTAFTVSTAGADIDRGPPETADEFALVPAGARVASIFSVTCTGPAASLACAVDPRASVGFGMPGANLPPPRIAAVSLADVDGDGALDLALTLDAQDAMMAGTSLAVSFGDGHGDFSAQPGGGGPAMAALIMAPALACSACTGGWADVLAIADLDGDGHPDFVAQNGAWRVHALFPFSAVPGPVPDSGRWMEAVVADFNRDGLPDVAATSVAGAGIDLLVSAGGGNFSVLYAGTDDAVAHGLQVGDFDGDAAPDLAFVGDATSVYILFSDSESLPRALALEASVTGATSVATVSPGDGLPAALALVSRPVMGQRNEGTLAGRGGRLLQSPVNIGPGPGPGPGNGNGGGQGGTVDFIALGRFGAQPDGVSDTLMLVRDPGAGASATHTPWLLETSNPIGAVPHPASLAGTGCDALTGAGQPALAAADLDGDQHDELVMLDLDAVTAMPSATSRFNVLWASVAGAALTCHALTALDGSFRPTGVEVVDVDRDGHLDLLVPLLAPLPMNGTTPMTGATTGPAEGFAVYYGQDDAQAGFAAAPVYYAAPADLRAVTVVAGSVAIVGASGSWLVRVPPSRVLPDPSAWPPLPVGVFAPGVTGLEVADVDGDGLDDLVLAGDTTAVMLQQECDAASAAAMKCMREGD